MKRVSLAIAVLCSPALPHAAEPYLGSSLTLGPSSNTYSVFAARYNPALAGLSVRNSEHWRLNYLPAFSVGVELGDVDNFVNEIDELIDILDDPSNTTESVQATLDRFNAVLPEVGENGYTKVQNRLSAPFAPLLWRPSEFSGTFFIEAELFTQVLLSVLDAPVSYDSQNVNYATASSAYMKSGIETRIAAGYSRALFSDLQSKAWGGQLHAGVKVKLINLELSKQVFRLQNLDGKDIEDVIEDEYENNLISTTNVSADLGLVWSAPRYRLGLTVSDINSPEFDYGTVGENCGQFDQAVRRNNCEAAAHFANDRGEIKTHETHRRHAVGTVDASVYVTPALVASAAYDLAAYDDIVGTQNQWLHSSLSYDFKTRWLPDLRLGYRENLVGSQIASAMAGFTLFNVVSFDAEMAMDTIEVDGTEGPRKFAFSLSLSEQF